MLALAHTRVDGARMPARSVYLVALSLSEAGPGRFGRQVSVIDIYHTIYHTSSNSVQFSSCCYLPAVSPGGLRWGFFFFGWDTWLIGLRFVFGAWGGSLGASVRTNVRVCLAGSGRFYLECTVGGPVVYMGRNKNGQTKRAHGAGIFVSCLDKLARHLVCIHVYRIKQAV